MTERESDLRLTIAVIVIACVLLAGCGGGNRLVGKWQDQATGQMLMEFKSDGQVTLTVAGRPLGSLPYKVEGENLITGPGKALGVDTPEKTQVFSLSGDTLTIGQGPGAMTLERAK